MIVKHAKVSGKADGGDSSLVRPSDWNADHVITGGQQQFSVTIPFSTLATMDVTAADLVPAQGPNAVIVLDTVLLASSLSRNPTGAQLNFGNLNRDVSQGSAGLNAALSGSSYLSKYVSNAIGGASLGCSANQPLQVWLNAFINVGPIATIILTGSGGGLLAGELLNVSGSGSGGVIRVDTVDGGGVPTAVTLITPGDLYRNDTGLDATQISNIVSSVLNAGGTGYAPGDTFTVNVGSGNAGVVDTVDGGGAVLTYHLTADGTEATTTTGAASTATSGIGTGLTLNIVAGEQTQTMKVGLTIVHITGTVRLMGTYNVFTMPDPVETVCVTD